MILISKLSKKKQKSEQVENEVIQLKHQKMLWHLQKHKSMQTKELDLLKEHNAAMILKLE